MNTEILAGSGHRPDKLGGYGDEVLFRLTDLMVEAIKKYSPKKILSGMALGYDTALALAAVATHTPFVAAVPFEGQESRWKPGDQARYRDLLGKAAEVIYVCPPGYAAWKMQKRNVWMVEHCTLLLTLFDGSPGGTANCVGYARKAGRDIVNIWPSWVKYKGNSK